MPPLTTIETRWFLAGDSSQHGELRTWFEACRPFPRAAGVGAPEWTQRAGGEPDVYLLMPDCTDMGVKWREGTLQVKGCVADLGTRHFGARREGSVQRWAKWTYPDLPAAYRSLFQGGRRHGLETVAVNKTRALRMIRLHGGAAEEVEPGIVLDHGVGFEMTDIELNGVRHCSIAFEAFPDDTTTADGFDAVVAACLAEFPGTLRLANSMSYPGWLRVSG